MFTTEEYLTYIGWPNPQNTQSIECNLETLITLQRLHSTSVPFDNFDFHITGTPLSVEPTYVWNKIKDHTRGTYCFQGNNLFVTALRKIGYKDALLIPVCAYGARVNAFTDLPGHCCVIVPLDGKWVFVDVATVDCLDGLLILSSELEKPQTLRNGFRYKFALIEDKEYIYPEDSRQRILNLDPNAPILNSNCVTVVLLKEDFKRDEVNLNPIEPIEKDWVNRFSFRLPKKIPNSIIDKGVLSLQDIVTIPYTLHHSIAEILLEYTVKKDPRSHHYKQWVGMRYSADCQYKFIIGGFRYIVVSRTYPKRELTWCGGQIPPPSQKNGDDNHVHPQVIPENAMEELIKHLIEDIGIKLTEDEINNLKINETYFMPNVHHIWAY